MHALIPYVVISLKIVNSKMNLKSEKNTLVCRACRDESIDVLLFTPRY